MSKISSDSENFLNFQVSESDNCSSVATAQIPVPQQRSSIRRNEYVNIPIPQRVSISIRSLSMWQYSQHSEEWIHDKHKIFITDVHVLSCRPPSEWAGLELAWHVKLPTITFVYCCTVHSTTCCVIIDLDVQCTTPLRITLPIPITEKRTKMCISLAFNHIHAL